MVVHCILLSDELIIHCEDSENLMSTPALERPINNLRTFYALLITQTVSLIGSQMTNLAVGIFIFQDTGQVLPLALVAFFTAIPTIFAAGLAGVLTDRWDRRYVMILSDIGQAVGTLVLVILFATDSFQIWHVYVISVWQAFFGIFQAPAFQATVTLLIPDQHRDRANAVQQLIGPASGIIGPVLAGVLFALIGVAGVMTLDLLSFTFAMIVVFSLHIPRPPETDEGRASRGSAWKEARVGISWLWSKRPLFLFMIAITFVNFCLTMALTMNTPYILTVTGSEETLGLLLGIMSLGPIIGGILISIWGGTRPRMNTIMPALLIQAIFLLIYGLSRSPIAMGIAIFFILLPLPSVNALVLSILQLKVPPDMQGRVMSAIMQMALILTPFGYLFGGTLADKVFEPAVGTSSWDIVAPIVGDEPGAGMALIIILGALLSFTVCVLAYSTPTIRQLEARLPDYVVKASVEAEHSQTPETQDTIVPDVPLYPDLNEPGTSLT